MITQLIIQNFGLIDKLSIDFGKDLNVFTGETGAGKTILIDALHYALGEKLNTTYIREKDKPCIVEAVFELSNKQLKETDCFNEYIQDNEPVLIINRSYTTDGRSRNKINGFTVTLSALRDAGNNLIDFHGPHDHQMLLSENSHITILDRLSDLDKIKEAYAKKHTIYLSLSKKLEELHELASSRERELDMLTHQVKELEQVPLDAAKYEELLQDRTRIDNAEKLYECANQLITILENDRTGISETIQAAFGTMKTLNSIDESTEKYSDILTRIQEDSSELLSLLNAYMEGLSFQPEEASEVNRQYDIYYEILRKYGPTIEVARVFYEKAREKHNLLIDLEHNDAELRKEINQAKSALKQEAQKITVKRKQRAKSLEKTIEKELKELGIIHVRFKCRIEKSEINRNGQDKVAFYISPNAGEELKPLAVIVSSGEAARVMLALKKALTKVDPIPVLIFDEIDAQIGGRLGTITGKKLKELAGDRQVILITHLPQIASFGDSHLKVIKLVKNNRTITTVIPLDRDERVKELAKMMSGEKESHVAVKHAEDMLVKAEK